jgi:S-adenosylmethionine synthetase
VDTYGGKGAHGGGAFSGKDPSKVDRSAAYAARHVAKNLVAAGVCDEVLVQVAYAIGVAKPVGFYVNTYGTAKVKRTDGAIANTIAGMKEFDMRPYFIEKRFSCARPIYSETAAYGHMGREPRTVTKNFDNAGQTGLGEGEALPLGGTGRRACREEGFWDLRGWLRVVSCSSSVVGRRCPWG